MQVLKDDIRNRVMAVATEQFKQKGFSKASMREITYTIMIHTDERAAIGQRLRRKSSQGFLLFL